MMFFSISCFLNKNDSNKETDKRLWGQTFKLQIKFTLYSRSYRIETILVWHTLNNNYNCITDQMLCKLWMPFQINTRNVKF